MAENIYPAVAGSKPTLTIEPCGALWGLDDTSVAQGLKRRITHINVNADGCSKGDFIECFLGIVNLILTLVIKNQ